MTSPGIDPSVIMTKLANMEDADAIAEFLQSVGVTGAPHVTDACPISNYLTEETGARIIVEQHRWTVCPTPCAGHPDHEYHTLPAPVIEFVQAFDHGCYPSLLEPMKIHPAMADLWPSPCTSDL